MTNYDQIYRSAFADAMERNLDGQSREELTPAECEEAVAYAHEFAEGEVEAARMHDTSRCPLGVRCESCGAERDGLAVRAVVVAAGVMCLTMCPVCASSTVSPPVAVGTAARLVAQHLAHLGPVAR